jgi:hypothetical protein
MSVAAKLALDALKARVSAAGAALRPLLCGQKRAARCRCASGSPGHEPARVQGIDQALMWVSIA